MQRFEADAPDDADVAAARHWFVTLALREHLDGDTIAAGQLIVSELVTNAIRHARTAFAVDVTFGDESIRIAVFDRDTRMPVAVAADDESTGGRGLLLVAAYADRWGTETAADSGISGKVVWAELAR